MRGMNRRFMQVLASNPTRPNARVRPQALFELFYLTGIFVFPRFDRSRVFSSVKRGGWDDLV